MSAGRSALGAGDSQIIAGWLVVRFLLPYLPYRNETFRLRICKSYKLYTPYVPGWRHTITLTTLRPVGMLLTATSIMTLLRGGEESWDLDREMDVGKTGEDGDVDLGVCVGDDDCKFHSPVWCFAVSRREREKESRVFCVVACSSGELCVEWLYPVRSRALRGKPWSLHRRPQLSALHTRPVSVSRSSSSFYHTPSALLRHTTP